MPRLGILGRRIRRTPTQITKNLWHRERFALRSACEPIRLLSAAVERNVEKIPDDLLDCHLDQRAKVEKERDMTNTPNNSIDLIDAGVIFFDS